MILDDVSLMSLPDLKLQTETRIRDAMGEYLVEVNRRGLYADTLVLNIEIVRLPAVADGSNSPDDSFAIALDMRVVPCNP